MKKLVNKLLFVLVIFMFLFSAGGCSSDTATSDNGSASSKQSTTATKSTSADTSKSPVELEAASVTKGIDGDTIGVTFSNGQYQKVRFIGVNTPESTTKHEQYGEEASNYTTSQLVGKTVYLEKDAGDKDTYGRLLRYVWIEPPTGINESEIRNKMFNAILAYNGYAQQMTVQPNVKYADYFKNLCADARNNSRGLWAININGTTKGDAITQVSSDTGNGTSTSSSSQTASSNSGSESSASQNNSSSGSSSTNQSSSTTSSNNGEQYVDANGNGTIIGDTDSKIYHLPGDRYYQKEMQKTSNNVYFKTIQEAEAAGYRPIKK